MDLVHSQLKLFLKLCPEMLDHYIHLTSTGFSKRYNFISSSHQFYYKIADLAAMLASVVMERPAYFEARFGISQDLQGVDLGPVHGLE